MGEGAACLHRNTAARRRQRRGGGPPCRGTPSPPRLSSCKPLGRGGSGGGTGTVCCHSAPLPPAAPQHGLLARQEALSGLGRCCHGSWAEGHPCRPPMCQIPREMAEPPPQGPQTWRPGAGQGSSSPLRPLPCLVPSTARSSRQCSQASCPKPAPKPGCADEGSILPGAEISPTHHTSYVVLQPC